jgi:hypothetical protein
MTFYSRRRVSDLGFLIALAFLAPDAHAQLLNGSFESANLSGWTVAGACSVQSASFGISPAAGTYQAVLETATDSTQSIAGNVGLSGPLGESALGLQSGSLEGLGNGTPIWVTGINQAVSLQAGQTVTFSWDFLTNQTYNDGTSLSIRPDANNDDFGFFAVVDPLNITRMSKLADVFDGYNASGGGVAGFTNGFTITPTGTPYISGSGYQSFTYSAPSSGSYTLAFGAVHASKTTQDNGVNSALLVDNVVVGPNVSSFVVNTTPVYGGVASKGTVTISSPAGTTPVSVALSTSKPTTAVTLPATISISSTDGLSKQFSIPTNPVDSTQDVSIIANVYGSTMSATLVVSPAIPKTLVLTPSSAKGGTNVSASLILTSNAGPSGITVALSSDNAAATVPSTITVPGGSLAKGFTVGTKAVTTSTTAHITAKYGVVNVTQTLTITP